jgi:xanthine dehydrogenase YagS FAD-binding subunit
MKNFAYVRATSVKDTIDRLARDDRAMVIAGGTNLVDRLKGFLDEPSQSIDISRLQMQQIERKNDGSLQIGALVTNTNLANNPEIRRDYPLLSRAILSGASQQIRNLATVGGNLMQRTRCPYFYDIAFACNKRQPNTGCPAATGVNRSHAIFGASSECVAVHPSDMCVALAALEAIVEIEGKNGKRQIPFTDFHRLPENTPNRDNNLESGEIITNIVLPSLPWAKSGVYLKLRDRASYSFALISVAAIVDLDGEKIRNLRLALGGVAHKPWRVKAAEELAIGKPLNEATLDRLAETALKEAKPLASNGFKVEMSKRAIRRAIAISGKGGGVV